MTNPAERVDLSKLTDDAAEYDEDSPLVVAANFKQATDRCHLPSVDDPLTPACSVSSKQEGTDWRELSARDGEVELCKFCAGRDKARGGGSGLRSELLAADPEVVTDGGRDVERVLVTPSTNRSGPIYHRPDPDNPDQVDCAKAAIRDNWIDRRKSELGDSWRVCRKCSGERASSSGERDQTYSKLVSSTPEDIGLDPFPEPRGESDTESSCQ